MLLLAVQYPPSRRCSRLDAWIVPAFFSGSSPRGVLKTRRCSGLDAWIVLAYFSGLSPRRDLKTRRCSRLDAWIVPVFCFRSSPRGALKTGRCSGLDAWIVPVFCTRSSQHRALKTWRCSELDQENSFWTQLYYPHMSRESVSPVCGIFHNYFCPQQTCLGGLKLFTKTDKRFKILYQILSKGINL